MIHNKKQFILAISILLVLGFFVTSFTSYFVSRSSLRFKIDTSELPLTSDTIYSEIQRDLIQPIFISSLMASDTFVRDWILNGEHEENKIRRYLKEIHDRHNTVTSFFVSEKTRTYYHYNGILKKVRPDDKRDEWYFRLQKINTDYETNVDPDMANKDTMTIFVNHKVFDYDGKFIGAAGIGLEVTSVKQLIDKYQQKYKRNIYFTDTSGAIVLHTEGKQNTIKTLQSMEGLSTIAGQILSSEKNISTFERGGKTVHFHSRFIPELNWYLLVEQAEDLTTQHIFKALIVNLLLCAFITLIIILLLNFTAKTYANNLANLARDDKRLRAINTGQEIEITKQNEELVKKNAILQDALTEVKQLSGLLPICASCKKIRDDKGYWNQIEAYISAHSEAEFSHSMCPECAKEFYPEYCSTED